MLSCMAPSSPPVKRTLHLLKTPDILCANDTRRNRCSQIDILRPPSGRSAPTPLREEDSDRCVSAGNSRCRISGLPFPKRKARRKSASEVVIFKDAHYPDHQPSGQLLGSGV